MAGQILLGDCRETLRSLPDKSVNCVVTSPPYFGLRDYGGQEMQIGREATPDEFVAAMIAVFREVHRVLRDDGCFWLNLGDSYCGAPAGNKPGTMKTTSRLNNSAANLEKRRENVSDKSKLPGFKPKDRLMIPARTALALHADGWYLRDEIVWHKPRTTPAPVKDRTVSAHEMIYLFSKSPRYWFDYLAIEEPSVYPGERRKTKSAFRLEAGGEGDTKYAGREVVTRDTRRKRSVWSVSPSPYKDAHFATYPPALIEPCILAGCPEGGVVLDPFFGSGTTGLVAERHGRNWIGCELNPEYVDIAWNRIIPARAQPMIVQAVMLAAVG